MEQNITYFITKIIIASFAATGLLEYLKNFLKTNKTWIYSVIMPFFAVGCYMACEYLPPVFVGALLTIGTVQLNYQVIVQSFKKVLNANISKINGVSEETVENKCKSDEAGIDFSEQ